MTDQEQQEREPEIKTAWRKITTTIQTKSGPEVVQAIVHDSLGAGLGVTGYQMGFFTVTHLASGKTVTRGRYERCANAMHNLLDLAPLADWTLDGDELKAECARRLESEGNTYRDAFNSARRQGPFMMIFNDEFPWEDETMDPWVSLHKREDEMLAAVSNVG